MKRYLLSIFVLSLFCFTLITISCTDNSDGMSIAEPGVYDYEMVLYTAYNGTKSRGIVSGNNDFDLKYDPNSIFVHVVGNEETVEIPLYTKACTDGTECKCFRYRVEKFEDGSAILTPILVDGTLAATSLTIPAGSECYFSSVEESIWAIDDTNIEEREEYTYYERESSLNKEIYRSINNFTVDELANNIETLIVHRACAAFNLIGLFYDGEEANDDDDGLIQLEEDEFIDIMGSDPSTWYIKIYIGGEAFVSEYDFGEMQTTGEETDGGYYSTTSKFQQFAAKNFGADAFYYLGYGYYTKKKGQLFTPTTGDEEINVYILIKHWEGDGEPTDEWLTSDENALFTKMNLTGYGKITPKNNNFYILGLLMDIRQFKKAWDNASQTTTKAIGAMRYFDLEDAKEIYEVQ